MFQKRTDTDRQVNAILGVFRKYRRGDVVPHGEIVGASEHVRGEPRYYALVRKARDRFRDVDGIWTREVAGVGFRLLSADESLTEEQRYRRKRMRRQAAIAVNVAGALPDDGLTDHQRRLKQHVIESHARMRREILDEERHEKWLLRPPADRPIKVIPPRHAEAAATN